MRKVVIARAGGYDRLQLETHPDPEPADDEVLVKTEAIGVNYADCIVRMGLYASAKKYVGYPITPGFEFAGTIAAVGARVSDAKIGAKVFGVTRFGAYATHVVVPRHQLFALPEGVRMEEASAFPVAFLTAYYALIELARPRAGMRILVHSAAGGVGSALLALGKQSGLHVVGVVGASHKVDAARAAGAVAVIDKSRDDLWSQATRHAPDGYDVVLDANGVTTLKESYRHLANPGRLVIYGFHSMMPKVGGKPDYIKLALDYVRTPRFSPLALTNDNRSVMAFNLSYLFERKDVLAEGMDFLVPLLTDSKIVRLPIKVFPLDRVADAHRELESGATTGKLVLIP